MAKVMISMPDEVLARLDAYAHERGLSRSGLLRDLAEREITSTSASRRAHIDRLLAKTRAFDGRGAEHVRRDRDAR